MLTPLFVSSELEPPTTQQDKKEKEDDDKKKEETTLSTSTLLGRNIPRTLRITTTSSLLKTINKNKNNMNGHQSTLDVQVSSPNGVNNNNNNGGDQSQSSPTSSSLSSSSMMMMMKKRNDLNLVDLSNYESSLIDLWEHEQHQRGFDWEIEKLRRFFGGLRMFDDGTWVQQKSASLLLSDYLVSPRRGITKEQEQPKEQQDKSKQEDEPTPPNTLDVLKIITTNFMIDIFGFSSIPAGITTATPVPNAVIQKYEGSFFTFIKGVLGGDLQTLAGGPLFLLLNKYFDIYGPIFNLSL